MTTAFITTIKERCRMCYTCVRECPAKAIRIMEGQAEVIAERCIACGNCVRVCSQQAKQQRSSVEEVESLLSSGRPVAACLAPSFPAEFADVPYGQVVGMLRALGFHYVQEVAFGADLVAREYRRMLTDTNDHRYIGTTCPAICGFVERYYPDRTDCLAPIVSPMVATARVVHRLHGPQVAVVFIGPCIAKKVEAQGGPVAGEVDAVLTFPELRRMLDARGVDVERVAASEFDPPHGAAGALFPISRGSLQAAAIREDLMSGDVVASEGRLEVVEALKEFFDGDLGAKLLEALCCDGCIMGAGITNNLPLFNRRRHVRQYVCQRADLMDWGQWQSHMEQMTDLDLGRQFLPNDQRIPKPDDAKLTEIMLRMGKAAPGDELNCGACGYDSCLEHAVAIYEGLAESEMCLPHTIEKLRQVVEELEESNQQLADTQEALMQSEKLASMGQLAAGIAHEVNNPLGVVLMYAHLLLDDCGAETPIHADLQMIAEQADRCKKIVAGLLHFARQNKVVRNPVDVREMIERAVRTIPIPETVMLRIEHDLPDPIAELDRDQIVQVVANLISNAVAAMDGRGKLTIRTGGDDDRIRLFISDTGIGIPAENIKRIFDPFFTTKPMGKGTGLGLAVSYGIVKMHSGDIRVQSQADPSLGPTGTTFTVTLPRRGES